MVRVIIDETEKKDLLKKIEDLHKEYYSNQLQMRVYQEGVSFI
jgi:argininosuccinate lyase